MLAKVLPHALTTAARHLNKMPRLFTMLPEVKAMTLLMMRQEIILMLPKVKAMQPEIALTLPKVKAMKCDEGYHI
jgi:hypothetical protein